ncbi:MAG: polysaccharide biosynthesis/export family protein, partial [Betaproteobacteria bacterium]
MVASFDILQDTPRELSKVILPSYTIEPPDILFLEVVQVIPKEPYHLQTGDVVSIQVPEAYAETPLDGTYSVGPGGVVELGASYGSVRIGGRTLTDAREVIVEHLKQYLKPEFLTTVSLNLLQSAGKQQVEGQHLVGPDGTVTLGTYGSVLVVGMTIAQAKAAIERHLSQFLEAPEVSVDVFSYNSKVFYVITQGAGLGDSVTRLPFMGNETVLDALANVSGLTEVSSKRIWIARPGLNVHGEYQILPVDWKGVTELGDVRTNYQIMPGDRVL